MADIIDLNHERILRTPTSDDVRLACCTLCGCGFHTRMVAGSKSEQGPAWETIVALGHAQMACPACEVVGSVIPVWFFDNE